MQKCLIVRNPFRDIQRHQKHQPVVHRWRLMLNHHHHQKQHHQPLRRRFPIHGTMHRLLFIFGLMRERERETHSESERDQITEHDPNHPTFNSFHLKFLCNSIKKKKQFISNWFNRLIRKTKPATFPQNFILVRVKKKCQKSKTFIHKIELY